LGRTKKRKLEKGGLKIVACPTGKKCIKKSGLRRSYFDENQIGKAAVCQVNRASPIPFKA